MGLFALFSKKESDGSIPSSLRSFLDDADTEYMRAFSTRSIRQLQNYVSRECAVKLSRVIFSGVNRYFGAPKFRNTAWQLQESKEGLLIVEKDVKFDSVRIGATLSVGVATDYKERWTVSVKEGRAVIVDISSA